MAFLLILLLLLFLLISGPRRHLGVYNTLRVLALFQAFAHKAHGETMLTNSVSLRVPPTKQALPSDSSGNHVLWPSLFGVRTATPFIETRAPGGQLSTRASPAGARCSAKGTSQLPSNVAPTTAGCSRKGDLLGIHGIHRDAEHRCRLHCIPLNPRAN